MAIGDYIRIRIGLDGNRELMASGIASLVGGILLFLFPLFKNHIWAGIIAIILGIVLIYVTKKNI